MAFQVNNVATLSLRKSSSNTDITNGNSCYSLANAKYGVYSNAACTSQVSTFTTNANGTSNSINLEPGTYYVKEISAPEGYYIDNTVKTVSLSSGENKVVSFTDKPMDDPAAIVIQKKDKYTGNTIKGKKTLAGAQFTIKYYDGFYDRNNLPARATRTWVIETKERTRPNGSKVYQAGLSDTYKVGGDNFYKVDGAITIPRGTITIQETKAPDGYRNDLNMTDTKGNSTVNGVYLAQVTKPGDLSTLMGGQTFEGSDSPVRADIKLTKINGTNNNTMANIPFKITNLETKESHTIYTGSNGVYDSSLIKKSMNTNTDKAGAGVWFGDTSILNDDEGSFEYGSYSIEELECKENNGKILYKGTFKIDNNTGATLDLGKIINNSIEVKTYAADNTSGNNNTAFYVPKVQTVLTNTANDHYFTTAAGSTLVDTVTYSGLKPGRAYTLTGKLMDKDTGKAATDKSGKEITGTATFTPSTANGTAKVNFSFDGSNLKGKTLVAYETLNGISVAYGIASSKKDLAIHKDISDADQSVTNMSLSTTAKDQKSGTKQVTLSRTAKIDDTVSYKGAIRGTSYKINGTLMNKSTGEAAVDGDGKPITASGVFTAGSATGTATVTFTFNTNGMAGGAYVAFEEVYETTGGKETLWGTHMDLNDEAQTVYVPSISTNLIDEDSQTNYTYIRDNVKAHDLVTYEGLIAGKTYKLTGTLVEKSTGKTFVDANGKTATITQTFTPDSDSGSVDMVFDINPSNLKTSALVAFETLSCNGEQVTIENDLDNEQQTLHFPILSTTAKGKVSGKNYVDIGGDMSIIDTIKYEGVQYGMTHTIKTYLVDKSTGKTVKDDNGNDIVKTTEWEPEATQGSIDVEIPVTGKKLAGRTLVVFEEIYLGDAMIACHKDINDANQTIKVKGYRDCTVIKRIKADDYWKEHGDPTFIFKLTGTDTLGASHTYYQSVTFTESYVKAHTDSDGYVEMKAIFGQVPAGEYTCSEESVSRFEFESLTKPVNATINGKTAVYHLTDNDTACATFANKKYEEGDFGHDSVVVNHFNHKTQD